MNGLLAWSGFGYAIPTAAAAAATTTAAAAADADAVSIKTTARSPRWADARRPAAGSGALLQGAMAGGRLQLSRLRPWWGRPVPD